MSSCGDESGGCPSSVPSFHTACGRGGTVQYLRNQSIRRGAKIKTRKLKTKSAQVSPTWPNTVALSVRQATQPAGGAKVLVPAGETCPVRPVGQSAGGIGSASSSLG